MLGRRFGTEPPPGYFAELARDPQAFRFTRGRAEPARMLETVRSMSAGAGVGGAAARAPARALGPRDPVVGTYRIPLLLGLYSDSPQAPPPYNRSQVQDAFFDAPSGTVAEYYDEVSGGDLELVGVTRDWVRSASYTQSAVTQAQSGLVCCGIGDFIKDLITLQGSFNWGQFDNDGNDGVPNSGDDDGYVDALAVMHVDRGAECGGGGSGNRIWSHKWNLSDASSSHQPHVTGTARAGGGFILIEDYFVQGVLSCDGTSLNEIGVFAHETGHAFGLPDLYDTRVVGTSHSGTGNWDVMGHGTWGCNDGTPERPCHMGAWSKAMLGWVDVITLDPDMDHGTITLLPVETARVVYRIDAQDGSGEYFLLENRQNIAGTYDAGLLGEGLLVWQIDQGALDQRWLNNQVNAFDHMAVWLRQADGADHLGKLSQSAGDPGDPFPGASGNPVFHAVSNPSSNSEAGTPTGLTLVDIENVGNDVRFRALTRFTRMTVLSTGSSASGLFTVDGDALPGPAPHVVLSAPFTSRTIEAVHDSIDAGQRLPFLRWTDAPSAPRSRVVVTPLTDTDYEAEYGSLQYELAIPLAGGVNGVAPGTIVTTPTSPDLWFAPGTSIDLSITPQTGFAFLGWTGALADSSNPTTVTMSEPIFGGANFQLTYAAADVELAFEAAVAQNIQLVATDGTPPIRWTVVAGSLPPGIDLLAPLGRLSGAALAAGSFPVTLEATDAIGLTDQANVAIEITAPELAIENLAASFLLAGPPLDALQQAYVDHQGNGDGAYDLGDFRAWVLAHPSLPLSASLTPSPRPAVLVVPVTPAAKAPEPRGER